MWETFCGYRVATKYIENRGRVGGKLGDPDIILRRKSGSGFGAQDLGSGGDLETA